MKLCISKSLKITFKYVYFLLCLLFLRTSTVHAYIDPSVMTYAIQAIAGIAIAIGTVFGLYWHKVRAILDDVFVIRKADQTEDVKEISFYDHKTGETRKIKELKKYSEKGSVHKHDFSAGIILATGAAFLLAIYAPLEMYFSNKSAYWYDIYTIFLNNILLFLLISLVLVFILFISRVLSRKLYIVFLMLGLIIFISTYLQGTILVSSLPTIDGAAVEWSQFRAEKIQSAVLWILVIITVVFLFWKTRDHYYGMSLITKASVVLITLIEIVTLVILCVHFDGLERKSFIRATKKNEFQMSADKNFVILLMDCTDSYVFNEVMQKNPEYADYFSDFTYYPDTLGLYPFTQLALPQILTGIPFRNETSFSDYQDYYYSHSLLFEMLKEKNYALGMYEEDQLFSDENMKQFINAESVNMKVSDFYNFAAVQLRMIWYKYAPYQLKYISDFYLERLGFMMETDGDVFSAFNQDFYRDVCEKDVTFSKNREFKFIHVYGAHPPFCNDKEVNYLRDNSGNYEMNVECVITMTKDYLQKLKDFGVYDNSIIIVMADHGYNGERQNPLLLIKGIDEHHDYQINEMPVSFISLPDVYNALLNGLPGNAVFGKQPEDRKYLMYYGWNNYNQIFEQLQKGKAWEDTAMTDTGVVFEYKN